jgi:hypothetical protein
MIMYNCKISNPWQIKYSFDNQGQGDKIIL